MPVAPDTASLASASRRRRRFQPLGSSRRSGVALSLVAGALIAMVLVGSVAVSLGRDIAGSLRSAGDESSVPADIRPAGPTYGEPDSAPDRALIAGEVTGRSTAGAIGSADSGARAIVRTAAVTVRAQDVAAARRDALHAVAAAGGTTVNETSSDGEAARVTLTVQVPADRFDSTVQQLERLGTVVTRTTQSQDVTGSLADLRARTANAEAAVERLRSLMARAVNVGEVVAVESQLTQRQGELEALRARVAVLEREVAMSTITLDLVAPAQVAPAPDAPGFLNGLSAGWSALLGLGRVALNTVGLILPFIPLVVVAGVGARAVWRRLRPTPGAPEAHEAAAA